MAGKSGGRSKVAATDRLSIGYTLALTAVFGGLTGYIASIQQIIFDVFDAGSLIGLVFAAIAAPMAVASWGNSRVVGRFGLRRTGHGGLIAFVHRRDSHMPSIAELTAEPLWLFVVMMELTFVAFAFTTSNFGTLAMTNMAPIAGTASSFQGVTGTIGGAMLGFFIGRSFDGTQLPFLLGLALCGAVGAGAGAVDRARPAVRQDRPAQNRKGRRSSPRPIFKTSAISNPVRLRHLPRRDRPSALRPTSSVFPRIAFSRRWATSGFSLR